MVSTRLVLLLAVTLAFGCAFQRGDALGVGAQKVADILVALEKQGKYNSFTYALKATGVDGDLAELLNNYDVGLTVLAAEDSAFPDAVEARNSGQFSVDLRRVIASHIIVEYVPYNKLITFGKGHVFATLGRPLHVVHPGALSASGIGKEGLEGPTSFASMRGAIGSVKNKNILDDGKISVQGVGLLLLPSATA